ncbi:MAG: hypothetical protein HKN39_01565 [Flavobacteriales bacterium]|nr:hypothetical protein [Flavobacteriales bacterium]
MKHEWRKHEKQLYLPKQKPELVTIPEFGYFTIEGKGDPNEKHFAEYVKVLYALSYGVKMSPKKGLIPEGYFEYTVYPLEGVWDISEEAKSRGIEKFDKKDLVFKLMIRQPAFVNEKHAALIIDQLQKAKPHELLEKVRFERIGEGDCVQMLHVGNYDSEPESFEKMEIFARENGLERISRKHREIYLSDARKVIPEKLKTVLRFKVSKD